MINEILHSVEETEKEAEKILADAKEQATRLKSEVKDEIASQQKANEQSYAQAAQAKKDAVAAEEAQKDEEAAETVKAEVAALESAARAKEAQIVDELAKRLLA